MKLYGYQEKVVVEALEILRENQIVCLSLGMRLGKTFISLALAKEKGDRILFVTKKKAIPSILEDAAKVGVEITCVNYESLHKLSEDSFDVIIVDECHSVSAYPKPSKRTKLLGEIFSKNKDCWAIMLSGTFSVESMSQHFHILRVTGKFWTEYKNFYAWFKDFGIVEQIRVAGRSVNTYWNTKDTVLRAIEHLFVALTQKEAGFSVETSVVDIRLANEGISAFCKKFQRDCVAEMEDYSIVGESAAAVLSKCLQVCGGTVIGDDEMGHILDFSYSKVEFIETLEYSKICIFTNFIHERTLLCNELTDFTLDMDEFKNGSPKYFIGSLKSYSEGFDLSLVKDCCLVLYSLCWSGSSFTQICDRQQNKNRVDEIKIYCPLIKDTPEIQLFEAVSNKKNFNNSFYNLVR